jgi:hypothetical protein
MKVRFKWYLSGEDIGVLDRGELPKRGDRFPMARQPRRLGFDNVLVIFVEEKYGELPTAHVSKADPVWVPFVVKDRS